MLISSRNVGDSIRIGESVSVRVLELKGNQVRIGITAQKSTPVPRQEVAEDIASNASLTSALDVSNCSLADGT